MEEKEKYNSLSKIFDHEHNERKRLENRERGKKIKLQISKSYCSKNIIRVYLQLILDFKHLSNNARNKSQVQKVAHWFVSYAVP
jgi:hypothetical protein